MTGDTILFAAFLLGLIFMLIWSWRQDPTSFPSDPRACKECGQRKHTPKKCKECGETIVDECLF